MAACGEVASDQVAIPLLLGLGVTELSMAVPAIPTMKDAVRALSMAESKERAAAALTLSSAAAVRALP